MNNWELKGLAGAVAHFAAQSHAQPGSVIPVSWLSGALHAITPGEPHQTGCQLRAGHGGEVKV